MTAIRLDSYRLPASLTGLRYRKAGIGLLGALWLILGGLAVAGPADWPVVDNTAAGSVAGESPAAVALDERGNSYIAGVAQTVEQGRSLQNVYIAKLDPSGQNRVYTARLSGTGAVRVRAIAVDDQGNAYVAGCASASGIAPGSAALQADAAGGNDAFIAKLDSTGSTWLYATYLGGRSEDCAEGVAVDREGNAYLTGWTRSSDFPVAHALQKTKSGEMDAFVAKLDPQGSSLSFSTYAGGGTHTAGRGIALDNMDAVLVAGEVGGRGDNAGLVDYTPSSSRAFILALKADGSERKYGELLGDAETSAATALAASAGGEAFVTGWSGLPLSRFVFVTRLGASGQKIYYRLIGAWTGATAPSIAVDVAGSAYVSGLLDDVGGKRNTKIVKLSPYDGSPLGSSIVSTSTISGALAIAVGKSGTAMIAGTSDKGRAFAGKMKTCSFRLSDAMKQVSGIGETGSIGIETTQECGWIASSSASWLEVYPSGTGFSKLLYRVAPNSGKTRGAIISVAGYSVPVIQAAAGLTPLDTTGPIRADAGFQLNKLANCDDCTSPTSVPLNAPLNFVFNATRNTTNQTRNATLTIPGSTFTIIRPNACAFGLSPVLPNGTPSQFFSFGINVGTVQVTVSPGCAWNPSSSDPWLSITSPNQSGSGTLTYNLTANPSSSTRTGFLTIGGTIFQVTQAGSTCQVTLHSTSANFSASTNSSSFAFDLTPSDCAWTVANNPSSPWITVNPANITDRTVSYSVSPNPSAAQRNGSINLSVAGLPPTVFNVTQLGTKAQACTYTLFPASQSLPPVLGSSSFNVTTQPGCPSNATSNFTWLSPSGAGSGSGIVNYTVTANPSSSARYGVMTVGGQSYLVTQAGQGSAVNCTANLPSGAFDVYVEGQTEVIGDLKLTCDGLTAPVTADIILTVNTNITNSTSVPAQLKLGNQQTQAGDLLTFSSLHWPGVALTPAAPSVTITGVRVDASILNAGPITGQLIVNSSSPLTVANATNTLANSAPTLGVATTKATLSSDNSGYIRTISFQELSQDKFLNITTPIPTRFHMVLSGIPAGVTIYAAINPTEGQSVGKILSGADCSGQGGGNASVDKQIGSVMYSKLTVTGGVATATWTMGSKVLNTLNTLTFPILAVSSTNPWPSISLSGSYAPVANPQGSLACGTDDLAASAFPRYRDFSVPAQFSFLQLLPTITRDATGALNLVTSITNSGFSAWTGNVNSFVPGSNATFKCEPAATCTSTVNGQVTWSVIVPPGQTLTGLTASQPLSATGTSAQVSLPKQGGGSLSLAAGSTSSTSLTTDTHYAGLTSGPTKSPTPSPQAGNAASTYTKAVVTASAVTASGNTTITGVAYDAYNIDRTRYMLKVDDVDKGPFNAPGTPDSSGVCGFIASQPYADCPNIGFTLPLGSLSQGAHTVLVTMFSNNNSFTSDPIPVNIPASGGGGGAGAPSVYIDSPQQGATVTNSFTLSGWAIDNTTQVGSPISTVQVKVDGNVVGNASYGASRPDVCAAFPGRPNCPGAGYSLLLNLSAGSHTITVSAINTDSTPLTGSANVVVTVGTPPVVAIDSPAPGATLSGTINVSGWAIDSSASGSAISLVQVKVDGNVVGNATYGGVRNDVCTAFPNRPGCPNVGYNFSLNTSNLSAGSHTLTVAATNSNASPLTGSASLSFTVPPPPTGQPPTVAIDAPAAGAALSGTINVGGWALDNATQVGTAISGVQVRVDGNVVGNATYGASRPDVCAAFPGRPGCPNVGYIFSFNTSGLSAGTHTLTVSATDSDATPLTTSVSRSFSVTGAPPIVFIDSPQSGAQISGVASVSGWAIDTAGGTPISTVQVRVDGNLIGTATYGSGRGDVCAAFPGRPSCPNVGYTFSLNTTGLSQGTHTLTVSATDSDASPDTGSATTTFTVPGSGGPTPRVVIDNPASGSTLTGTATLSGWAIDDSFNIATVRVSVDGNAVGNATFGSSRPDVCAAFPGRPGCPNVGWTFALDTTRLTNGSHTLTVLATDANADTGSASVTIQTGPPPLVAIDTPASGSLVSGIVNVTGWAIDNGTSVGTAIGSVQVKVDGNTVGTATYGTQRNDVCAAFPGRPGCPNVGYNFSLNTSTLTSGSHTITVTATDTDGSPDSGSKSVTVTK